MSHHTMTSKAFNEIGSDYHCGACGLFMSSIANRYPNYNPDNCSCVEAGGAGPSFGNSTVLLQSPQNLSPYDHTTAIMFGRPPAPVSYASSNQSRGIPGPEEAEREAPIMEYEQRFLTVVPPPGLGEDRHRQGIVRNEMSYQMGQYLREEQDFSIQEQLQFQEHYGTSHMQASPNRYLNQDVFVQPVNGRRCGKTKSWESQDSGGSGENSLEASETMPTDPVRGVGAWAQDQEMGGVEMERDGYGWDYPLTMSGVTESSYVARRR